YIAQRTILPVLGFRFLKPISEHVLFTDMNWEVYPPGFYRILRWISKRYGNPPVIVTENGASYDDPVEENTVRDTRRQAYLKQYLREMHRAIEHGQDVRGYFVWTLLDNFEWQYGYKQRFGLVHVDHRTQKRTPKESFHFYRDVATSNRVP
ncbi:MAG: family 1 glycosylhydrolase, partial [Alkalispirochaeta sp.]